MAVTTLNRTALNAITDDDGSGNTGSILDKATANTLFYAPVEAAFANTSGIEFGGPVTANGRVFTTQGLQFPATQNPSSNVNCLDDYEEGTWTPAFVGASGQSGQVYAVQAGNYVKVGKLVHVQGHLSLTTLGTITGAVSISGLPFAARTGSDRPPLSLSFWTGLGSSFVYLTLLVNSGAQTATFFGATAAAAGFSGITSTALSNTSEFVFGGTYLAAS